MKTGMENNFFRQANTMAMKQGVFFGLWWVMGLAAGIGSFSLPLVSLLALFFFFAAPFLGGVLSYRFKQTCSGIPYTLGQLYLHVVLLYFYAAIWLAAAVYVYFAFVDNGFFFGAYMDYLHRPEVQAQLSAPAVQAELSQVTAGESLDDVIAMLAGTPPAVFAANALTSNILVGFVLALPTALVVRYIHVTKTNKD